MPPWWIKAAVQRAIGVLPNRRACNELFQKHVTRALSLPDGRFEKQLDMCRRHLEVLERFGGVRPADGFRAVELGPGAFPANAVGMFLCGGQEIWTCDLAPTHNLPRVRQTLERFLAYGRRSALETLLPGVLGDRLARLEQVAHDQRATTGEDLLEQLGIHTLIGDARRLALPAGAVDLVVSARVFEYVPATILGEMLREFRRVLRPRGVTSHLVDLADEFAYFDRRISPLNFLRFSDKAWRWIGNPLIPLTRLRIAQYRAIFQEAGFALVTEENRCCTPEDLDRVPLAAEFQKFTHDDLRVIESWLVAVGSED